MRTRTRGIGLWVNLSGLSSLLDDLQRTQTLTQMANGGDEVTVRHQAADDGTEMFRVELSGRQVERLLSVIPVATIEERYGL